MAIDPSDNVYFYSQYAKAPFEWATRVGVLSYP
jgi:hypothetical protein